MSSCSMLASNIAEMHPGAIDDEVLVEAARSGEEWAFVELSTRNSESRLQTAEGETWQAWQICGSLPGSREALCAVREVLALAARPLPRTYGGAFH